MCRAFQDEWHSDIDKYPPGCSKTIGTLRADVTAIETGAIV